MSSTTITIRVVFGLTLLLTACAPRLVAVGPPRGGLVTQTDDPQAVRAALARALEARRFTIESEGDGQLIARLDHRGRTLRVRVAYDAESYQVAYEGSSGFGYRIDPQTQQPVISAHYPKYLAKLERTIQRELQRPAQQALEAEEARQEAEEARQRAVAEAAAQERAEERAESRRARRRERRRERRRAWAEMNREQQETERERLRTQRAEAEAEAERLRRQPVPVFEDHESVYVERFAFDESHARRPIRFRRGQRVVRSQAVGHYSSSQLGLPSACPGYWASEPQHYVTLRRDTDHLRVEISARTDTTLAIVTPSGQVWCDDDSAGNRNPRLEGRFPAGTYAIYVGTYEPDDRTRYALTMDEAPVAPQPVRRARVQPAQRRDQQTPDCRTSLLRAGHPASGLTYCRNAEPHCAAALFAAGHSPSALVYCRNVQPACAVELLQAGQSPSGLVYCR